MRNYWVLNQHGAEGPSALVEADGGMRIIAVHRFGTGIEELEAQQEIWDRITGKLLPTLKPFVAATEINEEGAAVHPDLRGRPIATKRGGRDGASSKAVSSRGPGGGKRNHKSGDR